MIELWGAEELLYDASHPDYFNNVKRNVALKHIAAELTLKIQDSDPDETNEVVVTVKEIKQTMKSLRTQFNKEKCRIAMEETRSGAGVNDRKRKTVWKFYDKYISSVVSEKTVRTPVEIVKSSMDIDTSSRSELDIMENTNQVERVDIDSDVLSPASTMAEKPPHAPKKTQQIVKQGKSKLSPSDDLLLSYTKVISSVAKRQNISASPITGGRGGGGGGRK